jgi:hypothetical protein
MNGPYVVTFNGVTWVSPVAIKVIANVLGVSCASSIYCTAILTDGYVADFNQNAASSPKDIDAPTNDLTALSCASSTFCVAVDGVGAATTGT